MATDVDKTFAYHKPGANGVERIQKVREAYSDLKRAIEAQCPASRERSVALTELETSAMWATKAIVVNDPDSVVDRGSTVVVHIDKPTIVGPAP